MAGKSDKEFGKRRLPPNQTTAPIKRSGHVALLVMGTLAIGGGAYAMMPHENCDPKPPGAAASSVPGQQSNTACQSRRSWSSSTHWYGGSSSHSSLFSSDTSSSHSASGTGLAVPGGSNVTRGGFGGFAHAFSGHFSGG